MASAYRALMLSHRDCRFDSESIRNIIVTIRLYFLCSSASTQFAIVVVVLPSSARLNKSEQLSQRAGVGESFLDVWAVVALIHGEHRAMQRTSCTHKR